MIKWIKSLGISLFSFLGFLVLALTVPFFVSLLGAYADPAGHNYRLDYLPEGEAVDAYLHTGEAFLFLVFGITIAVFLFLFILDTFFRKRSSHVGIVALGTLLLSAFCLGRAILNFKLEETVTGVIDIIAAVSMLITLFFFVKKSLDGDCVVWYYVSVILSGFLFYFCIISNYNILDCFSHSGDVIFWCGYAVTRYYLLTYLLLVWVNHHHDYEPAGVVIADI